MSVPNSFLLSGPVLKEGEEATYICTLACKRHWFSIGVFLFFLFGDVGLANGVSEASYFVLKHELLFHEKFDEVIFGQVIHVLVLGWGWRVISGFLGNVNDSVLDSFFFERGFGCNRH